MIVHHNEMDHLKGSVRGSKLSRNRDDSIFQLFLTIGNPNIHRSLKESVLEFL